MTEMAETDDMVELAEMVDIADMAGTADRNGEIDILFRRNAEGRTYMARQFSRIPLQIQKAHYYDVDGTAVVYSLNPAGGILQHDRLKTCIECEAGADAVFTTPGNNKFYKMDEGCARLWNRLHVHEGGVLEYLPEHNVPFAQAKVYQENEFRVERGGVLFAADMVTAGRVGSGERFEYDRYQSRTRIFVDGELVLYDNCMMEPQRENLQRIGLLEGYLSSGSFYVYAAGMDPGLKTEVNALGSGTVSGAGLAEGHAGARITDKQEEGTCASADSSAYGDWNHVSASGVRLAAGNIREDLMVVRFLGNSIIEMTRTMQEVWDICRRSILGKPALRLRKEFSYGVRR